MRIHTKGGEQIEVGSVIAKFEGGYMAVYRVDSLDPINGKARVTKQTRYGWGQSVSRSFENLGFVAE